MMILKREENHASPEKQWASALGSFPFNIVLQRETASDCAWGSLLLCLDILPTRPRGIPVPHPMCNVKKLWVFYKQWASIRNEMLFVRDAENKVCWVLPSILPDRSDGACSLCSLCNVAAAQATTGLLGWQYKDELWTCFSGHSFPMLAREGARRVLWFQWGLYLRTNKKHHFHIQLQQENLIHYYALIVCIL